MSVDGLQYRVNACNCDNWSHCRRQEAPELLCMRHTAIHEIVPVLATLFATVASGCVRSSFVRERSIAIRQLSQEIQRNVEACGKVYEHVKEAAQPVASIEPCQLSSTSQCPPSLSPPSTAKTLVEAVGTAKESAKQSAQSPREAQAAANKATVSAKQAHDGTERLPECTGSCGALLQHCQDASTQIQRVIDAAGELERRVH